MEPAVGGLDFEGADVGDLHNGLSCELDVVGGTPDDADSITSIADVGGVPGAN